MEEGSSKGILIGAEWIILTPHYVRPDWMNLKRERNIDQDLRPYVQIPEIRLDLFGLRLHRCNQLEIVPFPDT